MGAAPAGVFAFHDNTAQGFSAGHLWGVAVVDVHEGAVVAKSRLHQLPHGAQLVL